VRRIVVVLFVLTGLALSPAASARTEAPCAMKGSKTLAASSYARIYRTPELKAGGRDVYGCVYRTGHRRYLGSGGSKVDFIAAETYIGRVALAGRFVAFSDHITGRWGVGFSIEVVDLTTGTRRTATGVPSRRDSSQQADVDSIVLRKNGSAAWMYSFRPSPDDPRERFVAKLDSDGQAELARGFDIEPHSLALGGATVYWTQAGAPRSATLR
jgi:hypothetical protein